MGQLKISLLGPPDIRIDNRAAVFRTRKSLALLAYLAAENTGRRTFSRERLAALLWGDSDPALARSGLRTALTHLRQALAENDESPHVLFVERDAVGLRLDGEIDLDLAVVAQAATAAHAGLLPAHLSQLAAVAEAIRGEFMQGVSIDAAPEFDHWLYAQRQAWRQQADTIFIALARLQQDAGEMPAATSTALRWLAMDPTNEPAARLVMNLQAAGGDRPAALRTFDTHVSALNKGLGVGPSPETLALVERIRREGAPQRANSVRAEAVPGGSGGETGAGAVEAGERRAPAPSLEIVRLPMVGRSSEFARLVGAAATASQHQPQVVLVEGEAGIGKSRLADDFLVWARAQSFDVWQGRSFEAGGHIPYQAVVGALRSRMERENAPDDLISDVWLAELSRLLPELRERYPDLPAPLMMDGPEALARLCEAVTRFTLALATKAPLVLLIDDVQWADDSSRELLTYLARRWEEQRAPVLLLLTARTEAMGPALPLAQWVGDLGRALPTARIALGRLNGAHISQLAQSIAGYGDLVMPVQVANAVHVFGQWLYDETQGQPFFVVETLKALLESHLMGLVQRDGREVIDMAASLDGLGHARESLATPAGVRDVIRARLARLSPAALNMLTAAAILGQVSDFETLRAVASADENDGLRALDELLASQLLVEDINGSYLFTHDKIRAVAQADAGDARRRILHRRACEALQRAAAAPALLAHHALEARQYLPAFRFSLDAGEAAMHVFSLVDALAHFQRALAICAELAQSQPPPVMEIDRLYRQFGRALELSGKPDQALAAYAQMLQLAQERTAPVMECAALNRLATLTAQKFDPPGAFSLLRRAHEVAVRSGDRLGLAETEWNLAQTSNYSLDAAASQSHARAALALAREIGDTELTARCLNILAYAERALGSARDALAHAEESSRLYLALGNRAMQVDSQGLIADVLIGLGKSREALACTQEMLEIGLQIDNPWVRCNAFLHQARAQMDLGNYDQALWAGQRGVELTDPMAHLPMLMSGVLGSVQRARLEFSAARSTHLAALQKARQVMDLPTFWAAFAAELCADYVATHDWEAAVEQARFVAQYPDYDVLPVGHALHPVVRALLHEGEHHMAQQLVERFSSRRGEYQRYRLNEILARGILCAGDAQSQLVHLHEAATLADELGLPGEAWQIEAAMAQAYLALGDMEQADRCRATAVEIAQALAERMSVAEQRQHFMASAMRIIVDGL